MKLKLSTLVNIILSVVLLTSIFYVGITSSQGVYDPWCDQDSDGDIDIYDIVPAASAYGTTGNSTKDVTVTNWPRTDGDGCLYVNVTNWDSGIKIAGYEHKIWSVGPIHVNPWTNFEFVNWTAGYRQITMHILTTWPVRIRVFSGIGVGNYYVVENFVTSEDVMARRTYQIQGDYIKVQVENQATEQGDAQFHFYMTA